MSKKSPHEAWTELSHNQRNTRIFDSPQNTKKDEIFRTGIANILTWDFRVKIKTRKGTVTLPYIISCGPFG